MNRVLVIDWFRAKYISFPSRVCLRAWLEQDTVCPTCRFSLSDDLHQTGRQAALRQREREERGGVAVGGGRRPRLQRNARNAHNWLFRFNGASIASWLPTFSVELHQEDPDWVNDAAELHRVVRGAGTEQGGIGRWLDGEGGAVFSLAAPLLSLGSFFF